MNIDMNRSSRDKISPADFLAMQSKRRKSDRTQAIFDLVRSKLTAREAIREMIDKNIKLAAISRASKVNQTVLRLHVFHAQSISPKNAIKLEKWSQGVISSVKMFIQNQVA